MTREPRQRRATNPTLADIAQKAGVSIATVSRVLNNVDHPVSARTRERILSIAAVERYATNIYGKGLAGQPQVIGLCIGAPLSVDPGFSLSVARAIDGFKSVTRASEYHWFLEVDDDPEGSTGGDRFFAGVPLAGVAIVAPRRSNPLVRTLRKRGIPFIVVGSREFRDSNYVDADNRYAGREAARHIARVGRRRFAWLGGPRDFAPSRDMEAGLRAELKRRRLPLAARRIAYPPMTVAGGRAAAVEMLTGDDPPDAFFCFTDFLAVGVIQAARELGRHVPRDLSVVGYDDFPISEGVHPQLTTFRHPDHEMAAFAARRLVEDILPRGATRVVCQKLFRPQLIVRESCGAQG